MLLKKNRVSVKLVEKIFKSGKFINSTNLTFRFILTGQPDAPRISFISPKNIAKLATKRNLLRRRGYGCLKKHINSFPSGLIGVFIFRKFQEDVLVIENEIQNISNKIH